MQETTIEGVAEHIVFRNEDNGYTVFVLKAETESGEEELTCTGYLPEISPGEDLLVKGKWTNNPRYGPQLSVSQAEKRTPTTAAGIEKYLASGVIKGIGAGMARRIVAAFGEHSFDVIAESPERLAEIKGITPSRAERISEQFHSQGEQRRAILLLQDYGISPAFAMRIYKKYKGLTADVLQSNPYKLADDIDGIGFKIADDIARRVGVAFDSPFRISAGLRFCLWEAAGNGHVYLPQEILISHSAQLLGVEAEREVVEQALRQMQMDKLIYCERRDGETSVFLSHFYHAELTVARKLMDLSDDVPNGGLVVDEIIAAFENESGMQLSPGQKEAVAEANSNGVLIITGGPGTGKTTTINTIIHMLSAQGLRIELSAPTGRAAKRITETSGREARTLHRLLESTFTEDSRRQTFQRNDENPLETDVLVIDEASMIDILLMQSVLKALAKGTRLIMVGDVDQLPPVGAGNVLKDLISSGSIRVVRLTEIFRQAQESAIIMNAHRINRGEYPSLNEQDKDFFFVRRQRQDDVAEAVLDLVSRRLPEYMGGDGFKDIQVLSPMRKSNLGVNHLNQLLQSRLNPPAFGKKEREFRQMVFREGDKVMQVRNNYQISWQITGEDGKRLDEGEGVYNGDGGVIFDIDDDRETLTVLFDDNRRVVYDYSQLDELELAYAITVHKSQGSEYKTVVMPVHSGPDLLFNRNLLYTAVTRAKELCVVVGVEGMLFRMVDNNREFERYTGLGGRMNWRKES